MFRSLGLGRVARNAGLSRLPQRRTLFQPAPLPFAPEAGLDALYTPEALSEYINGYQAGLFEQLNQLTAGTPYEDRSLESLVRLRTKSVEDVQVAEIASQAWNTQFFLHGLSNHATEPRTDITYSITSSFASIENFKEQFTNEALGIFGSGWVWLLQPQLGGKVYIVSTFNGDTPMSRANDDVLSALNAAADSKAEATLPSTLGTLPKAYSFVPTGTNLQGLQKFTGDSRINSASATGTPTILLGLSVWENAYMRDHGVAGREKYVRHFLDRINWDRVYLRQQKETPL